MNLDHEKGHSLGELAQNLAEAIAWCSSRPRPWSPFTTFRSADIAPEFGSSSRKSWIDSVATQRRHALGSGTISLQKRFYRHEGRLLAYFPDDNLACGVAMAETEGFFTVDNVPPWDTWVAYLQEADRTSYVHQDDRTNYLVAWVPGWMMRRVREGIRLIPENCAGWLDVRCPHVVEALAARGLEFPEGGFGAQ